MLSQLIISLSLLFILSGSTLCLLLTLWLDIAFDVFHICVQENEHETFLITILLNLICV